MTVGTAARRAVGFNPRADLLDRGGNHLFRAKRKRFTLKPPSGLLGETLAYVTTWLKVTLGTQLRLLDFPFKNRCHSSQ